jgi:hypothetical protein
MICALKFFLTFSYEYWQIYFEGLLKMHFRQVCYFFLSRISNVVTLGTIMNDDILSFR